MAETILITGASGFVGRHLALALEARGHKIVPLTHGRADAAAPITAPDGVTCVVHLAARTFVPKSWEESADFYRVNVQGTIQTLEFCRRAKARMIFTSTYVYGQPNSLPIPEDHPRTAMSPFHHSKILAEDACLFYASQFGIPTAIVRPFNIYGPGQVEPWLIPSLMRQMLAPGDSVSMADTRPSRDYIYVDDVVRMIVEIAERKAGGIYNAGSGVSTSMADLLDSMARAAGVSKQVVSRNEPRPNEIFDLRADITKARRDLHWSPQVSLDEGLRAVREAMQA